jgi:tyrosine decarboxylase/aspartate 1-decarboxylase
MREKGLSKSEVLARLKKIMDEDSRYERGKILCSMCTTPLSVARLAHQMFLCSNLGDPGLFPGSYRLEKEVIKRLAVLLNGDASVGFIVSGGSEANLMALLIARNMANSVSPEVILPESAHFSFAKICNLLGLKSVTARLDSSYRVDTSILESQINRNTIGIVGTAGTAELGVVDPIDKLSEIALRNNVYLHVDAAFGGLVIPFLKDLGYNVPDFDFRLAGVKSITVDPHKMGMSTIPAGGILLRDRTYLDYAKTDTPYLTEQSQFTFVGTRSAASVAATWAAFEALGRDGFRSKVDTCIKLTDRLSSGLESSGFKLVTQPTMNIVAFRGPNSKLLSKKLRKKGWFVSYVPRLDCIRIIIMPHQKNRHIKAFLDDLREIT